MPTVDIPARGFRSLSDGGNPAPRDGRGVPDRSGPSHWRDLNQRFESLPRGRARSTRIGQPLAHRRGFAPKRDPHDALHTKGELRTRSRFARASQEPPSFTPGRVRP
jgi:hypothetical protein